MITDHVITEYITVSEFPLYEVSDTGIVREKSSRLVRPQYQTGKLKDKRTGNSYLGVSLFNGTEWKTVAVHRIVATAFVSNPENKPQVNHINGRKGDNRCDNLEWVTIQENRAHSSQMGLDPSGDNHYMRLRPWLVKRGSSNGNSKLTESDVLLIRQMCLEGFSNKQISEKFNITGENVSLIRKKRAWKHI